MSNFPVRDGRGNEKPVPVVYGDLTRQVAHIIRDNSENKLPSAPRMSVYVTALEMDRDRAMDATHTHSVNIRERKFDPESGEYLNTQGANYTVERLVPTPYTLKANVDIWTSSTDQKLQLLEQILALFHPSLEIQTTDNFIDWTSLTVVELENVVFSNRSVPVGLESEIDIATLSFTIPIFISSPVKVKKMGIITNIITSIFDESRGTIEEGMTAPELAAYDDYFQSSTLQTEFGRKAVTPISSTQANVNYNQYPIYVDGSTVKIIYQGKIGGRNWHELLEALPGNYLPNVSKIFISNYNSDAVLTGTFSIPNDDNKTLVVDWDTDSFPQDSVIDGPTGPKTTIDYIIDPSRFDPRTVAIAGTRLLLLDNIGDPDNADGPDAWKNNNGTDFVANADDIVEWDGNRWHIVFDASEADEVIFVTNLNTNTQYRYADGSWLLSVDGEYSIGTWRLDLYG